MKRQFNQYSTIVQFATTLFLVGWLIRPPLLVDNFNNCNLQKAVNTGNGLVPVNKEQQHHKNYQYGLHQVKEVENHYCSHAELKNLLSWKESYRRGDFNFFSGSYLNVLPILNNNDEQTYRALINLVAREDDGYGSSGTLSMGSPLSSSSSFSSVNNLVDLSWHQDDIDNFLTDAIGYTTDFDIDQLIDGIDSNFGNDCSFTDVVKSPFLNSEGCDQHLECFETQLKNPAFDEYLASPNPILDSKTELIADNTLDNLFKMNFCNSSVDHNPRNNALIDFDDFDLFDMKVTDQVGEEEFDLIQTESFYPNLAKDNGEQKASVDTIHIQSDHFKHGIDHDYPKRMTPDAFLGDDLKTTVVQKKYGFSNLTAQQQTNQLSFQSTHHLPARTFAPINLGQSNQVFNTTSTTTTLCGPPKFKKDEQLKNELVWPDFPYTSYELITMPVETFTNVIQTLSKHKQLHARDIRRKGKNKYAARNCRKRKIDRIDDLDSGVNDLIFQRQQLLAERDVILKETREIQSKTQWLSNYIFEQLRDVNGRPYSSSDYSLQYTSDGNVYLVPTGAAEHKI